MNTTKKASLLISIAILACSFTALAATLAETENQTVDPLNQETLANGVVAQVQNGILKLDFQLSSNTESLPITWAITLQDPTGKVCDIMSATGAVLTPTPQHMKYTSPLLQEVHGTWTATIQVYRDDGTTGLGVKVVNFTL